MKKGFLRLIVFLTFLFPVIILPGCSSDQVTGDETEESEQDLTDPVSLEGKFVVHYINLVLEEKKAGDAIIIQTPEGSTMMIDAGRTPVGDQVDQYLEQLDIETIDYAVTTHPHIDHIGGYLTLIETKEIGTFLLPNVTHVASTYKQLVDKINEYEINSSFLDDGDVFTVDEELAVAVFSPPEGTQPPNETDINTINDLSLVLKLTFGKTSFLFTGDIGMSRESTLISNYPETLGADFLHAPHHGSSTSSSLNFIQTVDPKFVVISNDKVDTHVFNRYENHGSEIYITGNDGHIVLISDGNQIEVVTGGLKNLKKDLLLMSASQQIATENLIPVSN